VVDAGGALVAQAGDQGQFLFFRSSAKPFQAIPVIESGAADDFGLTAAELALCCASHSGTVRHQEQVAGLLTKLGLDEAALQCGAPFPYDPKTGALVGARQLPRSPLGCDCSGKHSGMLAACLQLGYPTESYLAPEHPLQRQILGHIAELCGVSAESIPLAIDGCSLPTFGGRLSDFARAWAHLAAPTTHAAALLRLRSAMLAHPENVAGDGVLDTDLMRAGGLSIVAKTGAEGLICLALPTRGLGVAIRIADGSFRALRVVVEATLRALGGVDEATLDAILPVEYRELRNHNKLLVGEIRATVALRTHA
jgi:L-asparaginase II